jgi:hypothetical protein
MEMNVSIADVVQWSAQVYWLKLRIYADFFCRMVFVDILSSDIAIYLSTTPMSEADEVSG